MPFIPRLLELTNFRSPLLRTLVPSVAAAFALQTAVAAPSVAFQTERFYDLSGSLTYLAVGALSLYLPALRARAAAAAAAAAAGGASGASAKLPSLLSALGAGQGGAWNWRQVVLTGAVTIWAVRCELLSLRVRESSGAAARPSCHAAAKYVQKQQGK